jgi:hypothetical protein
VQSDVLLAQGEVARLSAELEAQQRRAAEAERELEQARRDPSIEELDGGSVDTLGRPPVPPPWASVIHLFAFGLLLAEAWQLAVPVLEAAGVRTGALAGELARAPAPVVLGFTFALGAAVSLFFFVDLALRRVLDLFAALPAERRTRWTVLGSAAALAFAAAVSWSIAGLRPGGARVDHEYARFTLFLLALALPVTTSLLLRLARALHGQRAEALRAAVAWDQQRYRALAGWTRRATVAAAEGRELARIDAERTAAMRRIRTLRGRALAAERLGAEVAEAESRELEKLSRAIASALELDRYEFLRLSRGRRPAPVPAQTPVPAPVELAGPRAPTPRRDPEHATAGLGLVS